MNISAIIKDLTASQKNFSLIKEFNKLSLNPKHSCSVFVERIGVPVIKPLFSCPIIAFFSGYTGKAISTTLSEATTMIKTATNADMYLYLWDLEWLTRPVRYEHALNILTNKDLKIIARSESHAKVIENFCNKKVCGIVDNWESEKLLQIIGDE